MTPQKEGVKRSYDVMKSSANGSIANLLEKTSEWNFTGGKKRSTSNHIHVETYDKEYNFTNTDALHLANKKSTNAVEMTNINGYAGRRTSSMPNHKVPYIPNSSRIPNRKIYDALL